MERISCDFIYRPGFAAEAREVVPTSDIRKPNRMQLLRQRSDRTSWAAEPIARFDFFGFCGPSSE
jgi:hypothetical protein